MHGVHNFKIPLQYQLILLNKELELPQVLPLTLLKTSAAFFFFFPIRFWLSVFDGCESFPPGFLVCPKLTFVLFQRQENITLKDKA